MTVGVTSFQELESQKRSLKTFVPLIFPWFPSSNLIFFCEITLNDSDLKSDHYCHVVSDDEMKLAVIIIMDYEVCLSCCLESRCSVENGKVH